MSAFVFLAGLGLACHSSTKVNGSAEAGAPDVPGPDLRASDSAEADSAADLAGSPEVGFVDASDADGGAACTTLNACQCLLRPDCQPFSESCWCPFPQCGSSSCVCGGGRF